jgi:hypothetical protein
LPDPLETRQNPCPATICGPCNWVNESRRNGVKYSSAPTRVGSNSPTATFDVIFRFFGTDAFGLPLTVSVTDDHVHTITLTDTTTHQVVALGSPLTHDAYQLEYATGPRSPLINASIRFASAVPEPYSVEMPLAPSWVKTLRATPAPHARSCYRSAFAAFCTSRSILGLIPLSRSLRATSRRSRASRMLISGYTPSERSFSLPANRYFNRHHLEPAGDTSRQ